MTIILVGADSNQAVHLHLVVGPEEATQWPVGTAFIAQQASDMFLRVDADVLGAGSSPIQTLSFIRGRESESPIYSPEKPVGTPSSQRTLFAITATENGAGIEVAIASSLLTAPAQSAVMVDARSQLLVETWTMGRALVDIRELKLQPLRDPQG